jgi:hypothetical protein
MEVNFQPNYVSHAYIILAVESFFSTGNKLTRYHFFVYNVEIAASVFRLSFFQRQQLPMKLPAVQIVT